MRTATIQRTTAETTIQVSLNIDDPTVIDIQTGIGFLDHMLTAFAKHGRFGLEIKAQGDLQVDPHHTTEDVGIVLGACFKSALGDKAGIERFGSALVPLDETLSRVVIDLSGRAYLVFDATFDNPKLGTYDTEVTEDFFQAFAFSGAFNCHAAVLYGRNTHHKIETLFKALGRAMRAAVTLNPEIQGDSFHKGCDLMLTVIDYDTGNTQSVKKALDHLNIANNLSADPTVIAQADGLILPGVGAFQQAMVALEQRGLVSVLQKAAGAGQPILGICLGMQLLFETGYEFGVTPGLGILPGVVAPIPEKPGFKIPHMGWNRNKATQINRFGEVFDGRQTYFVHAYYVQTAAKNIIATTDHSVTIPSVVQQNNVVGMQFHPEKSGAVGLAGLKAFKEMVDNANFSRN